MPTPGYRSVTIHQKSYEDAQILANLKGFQSVSELFEWAIDQFSTPYLRGLVEYNKDYKDSKRPKFVDAFHAFVLDWRKVKYYQSASWVHTPEYVKKMDEPMLRDLETRFYKDDEFNVDKLFIVSRESWKTNEVWEWINSWLSYSSLRKKQLRIFVLREKAAEEILRKLEKDAERRKRYLDMGIYKAAKETQDANDTVGFLEIKDHSEPGNFEMVRARENPQEVKTAEKYFHALKESAERIEGLETLPMLKKQPYDSEGEGP